jgi:cyclopropane-fatty-acyl-phospholipid synthase
MPLVGQGFSHRAPSSPTLRGTMLLLPSLRERDVVGRLLERADVQLDGGRPFDLQVRDPRFFRRVLAHGSLGFGESFMDGWWDCEALDELMTRILAARLDRQVHGVDSVLVALKARLLNLQRGRRAWEVAERHYDLGNELYQAMLGRRLVYSCGYWQQARDLDSAQLAKLDLVCRKLQLAPGMRVLDIGCGWGEALKYAAETYGVSGVGLTLSREQAAYARELCRGLPVEIRLQDYRDLDQRFDRVFSIGMFEHVGARNYRTYFERVRAALVPDGLSLLHTIGGERSTGHTDPWIAKYIFPNSMLPSAAQVTAAVEELFVIEDWHGFGADYDPTLMAWLANVERAWASLPAKYDQRFRRMWRFYLCCAAAGFRTRRNQLWQVVLSPNGVPGGYVAPR